MNISSFILPFGMWFTSDLFKQLILTIFVPFVIVACTLILIKEILTR